MARTYSRTANRSVASQRITRQNLLTLRAAEMKEDKMRKVFGNVCNEIWAVVTGMCAMQPEKKNSMCKYYGHVIRNTSWKGYLPKCADCGCEISNPSQLRKAQTQEASI